VLGTQFESSQAHHAVPCQRRFPVFVRKAPNTRRKVSGLVSEKASVNEELIQPL
jgi:hypothetical protein